MSLVGKRAEIAAALTNATDVTGYSYKPTVAKTGDGWPQLGSLERADASAYEVNWNVYVIAPNGEREASDWFDSHHEDIADALSPIVFVDKIEPVRLASNAGDQYAIQFTVRSE